MSNVWMIVTSIATLVSTIAYILTALYIRAELKAVEKDRFLNITSELFAIWQNEEFMRAQMWIINKMEEDTWEEFLNSHRGDYGEIAFHRVGSYYDRIGTLVRLKLIDSDEILSTVGGYAIAIWQRLEPLVFEARKIENSVLFDDFEAILPACYECYVPALGDGAFVRPFSGQSSLKKVTVKELKKRLDSSRPPIVLDVRKPHHSDDEPRTIPGSVIIPPDQIHDRFGELPKDREIVVFCACPHDETSSVVTRFLVKQGFKAVVLAGGHTAWMEAGYPLEMPLVIGARDMGHGKKLKQVGEAESGVAAVTQGE